MTIVPTHRPRDVRVGDQRHDRAASPSRSSPRSPPYGIAFMATVMNCDQQSSNSGDATAPTIAAASSAVGKIDDVGEPARPAPSIAAASRKHPSRARPRPRRRGRRSCTHAAPSGRAPRSSASRRPGPGASRPSRSSGAINAAWARSRSGSVPVRRRRLRVDRRRRRRPPGSSSRRRLGVGSAAGDESCTTSCRRDRPRRPHRGEPAGYGSVVGVHRSSSVAAPSGADRHTHGRPTAVPSASGTALDVAARSRANPDARALLRVKQTEQVLTPSRPRRHPRASAARSRRSVWLLTALAATCRCARHLGDRVPYATWTIGESTMWVLALFSCVALVVSGPWLSWRLPTNRTGLCLTVAGFALAASIYGQLHADGGQSVGRATPADGVPRGDRGRRVELAHGPDAGAMVEAVPAGGGRVRHRRGGQQVRLRRTGSYGPWWPAHDVGAPRAAGVRDHCASVSQRRGRGAPWPSPRSCSSPSSPAAAPACRRVCGRRRDRRSSRPRCSASPSSGPSCRRWRLRRSAGSADGPRPIGIVGAWVELGRYGAVALLLVWSESMRRRSEDLGTVERDRRSSWEPLETASTRPTRWRGSSVTRPRGVVVRGADAVAARRRGDDRDRRGRRPRIAR